MKIDAGTEALYEGDSAALAARNSTVTGTPPERRENRTDEDSNQNGQQRGVISDSITQRVGRRQHPLAERGCHDQTDVSLASISHRAYNHLAIFWCSNFQLQKGVGSNCLGGFVRAFV